MKRKTKRKTIFNTVLPSGYPADSAELEKAFKKMLSDPQVRVNIASAKAFLMDGPRLFEKAMKAKTKRKLKH